MANPPIVIGSFSNVPAPGSPIRSDWAQQVTRSAVHLFATVAARDAWTSPPDGAKCWVQQTLRDYRRVAGVWQTIPIEVAGAAAVTGDGAGNGVITFARALPATPNVVIMNCLDYANVGCIPFNTTPTGTSVGLRRPGDNSPVGGIAVGIGYIAVLL